MARRANGEGTIRKRGDGRWEGRYYDPEADKQRSVYGRTQKEVREKLSKIAVGKDTLTFVTPNTITVDEWFELFINTYKEGIIRPQSVAIIKSYYKCHIRSHIGEQQLQKVTKENIVRLLKAESTQCSTQTVKQIKTYLSEIFAQAVKSQMIKINPATGVQIPRNQNPDCPKRELSSEELYWFFRGLNEHKHNDVLFFSLLLTTGIRRGEAIALKWRDFSEDFKFVNINSTYVQYMKDGCLIKDENPPKSRTSIRSIPIQKQMIISLQAHKERAQFVAKQFDRDFAEDDYVFIESKTNQPLQLDHFKYTITAIRNYLKKEYNVDIDRFSPHYFRHTFATMAMRNNIPLETVKQLMGHSKYDMILKYAHSSDDDKINAINKMFG